jgi:quercetin dioxygenase-like cupin family protein
MPTQTATVHAWKNVPKKEVTQGLVRQFVTASRVTIAKFSMARGTVVPPHQHENEQVTYVVTGALNFNVAGQDVMVRAGELLEIPPQVPHGVEVVEDAEAIDVFSPVRQDWIDGTDTYFKKQ